MAVADSMFDNQSTKDRDFTAVVESLDNEIYFLPKEHFLFNLRLISHKNIVEMYRQRQKFLLELI